MAVGQYLATTIATCHWRGQYYFHKLAMTSLLGPPVSVKGMICLDRAAFTSVVDVPSLVLRQNTISKIMPVLKKYLLKLQCLKPVQKINDEFIVYLNPLLVKSFEDITENDRNILSGQYDRFERKKLMLNYNNWRSDEILRAILPDGIEVPTSYSLVGHIVHLNLRDVHLPYKTVIAQVILDHVPTARTVVNKINTIDTTFRHFAMEILVGHKDTIATVKENGCTYQFDFAQVYWNPRLSGEHLNLITLIKPSDTLYDIFAGVGPFAIPAARKRIKVLANDLNPESYKWLQINARNNKIKENFKAFNMDGRDFLRNVVKADILKRRAESVPGAEHIAMNLPAMAVEFLDVLFDWFTVEEMEKVCLKPPTIHVYCFVKCNKTEDPCKLAKIMVEEKLGCTLHNDMLSGLRYVRNVAPSKEMIRVSFLFKKGILKGEEPAMKKLKTESSTSAYTNDNITVENGKEQRLQQGKECIQSGNSP